MAPPLYSWDQRGPLRALHPSAIDCGYQAANGNASGDLSGARGAFRTEWRTIARLVGLNAAYAVGFYLCFVYITTYLRQTDHVSASKALDINTIAIAVLLLLIPLAGVLSDRLGRKPVMLAATGGLFVLAWPLFWMMHHPDTSVILLGQLSFAVLVQASRG
jgi:MHS family proline/betaine transporter-like MFS transporter